MVHEDDVARAEKNLPCCATLRKLPDLDQRRSSTPLPVMSTGPLLVSQQFRSRLPSLNISARTSTSLPPHRSAPSSARPSSEGRPFCSWRDTCSPDLAAERPLTRPRRHAKTWERCSKSSKLCSVSSRFSGSALIYREGLVKKIVAETKATLEKESHLKELATYDTNLVKQIVATNMDIIEKEAALRESAAETSTPVAAFSRLKMRALREICDPHCIEEQ